MKLIAKKKDIKEGYYKIIRVGYCNMQNLLAYKSAFAYSTRVEGWACDYYDIGGICISTGYSPIGNLQLDDNLTREYEQKASGQSDERRSELLKELLDTLNQ